MIAQAYIMPSFGPCIQVEIPDWPKHLHLQRLVVPGVNKRDVLLRFCDEIAGGTLRRDPPNQTRAKPLVTKDAFRIVVLRGMRIALH